MEAQLSRSLEDYLKEIYTLQAEGGRATTSALAKRRGVAPPSVTAVLGRLAALGLVEHERYRGAVLTPAGERAAVEIVRHHRLLEQYLAETLGLGIDAVHEEAELLEHYLSDELEARIDESLGFPTHDPHGHPIPDGDLNVEHFELRKLSGLAPGETALIERVPDADPDLLRYLAELRLLPGERVEMQASAPFGGPLTVIVAGVEVSVAREIADRIGVSPRGRG
ncbi:MAG TPA: metal-dependent transcriptional regulator [Gaiellaceae bacterium]|jgi:DtxR family Mn-dependent transcriptional regulator|nr:metal-dependent transcriptional regulator [Gaiellaceae bacterium]